VRWSCVAWNAGCVALYISLDSTVSRHPSVPLQGDGSGKVRGALLVADVDVDVEGGSDNLIIAPNNTERKGGVEENC